MEESFSQSDKRYRRRVVLAVSVRQLVAVQGLFDKEITQLSASVCTLSPLVLVVDSLW